MFTTSPGSPRLLVWRMFRLQHIHARVHRLPPPPNTERCSPSPPRLRSGALQVVLPGAGFSDRHSPLPVDREIAVCSPNPLHSGMGYQVITCAFVDQQVKNHKFDGIVLMKYISPRPRVPQRSASAPAARATTLASHTRDDQSSACNKKTRTLVSVGHPPRLTSGLLTFMQFLRHK